MDGKYPNAQLMSSFMTIALYDSEELVRNSTTFLEFAKHFLPSDVDVKVTIERMPDGDHRQHQE